jgi:propanediol dehydratase small subunit
MLRPGRSSAEELDELAEKLAGRGAQRSAELVREARATYVRRGLIA